MFKKNRKFLIILIIFFSITFVSNRTFAQDEEALQTLLIKLENIQKDVSTLEKAVYSNEGYEQTESSLSSFKNEDVLTRHLLKLSEIEEQFKDLTNRFEEINFKLDKLSNRITKIQTDNQTRFQDLESRTINASSTSGLDEKKSAKLPGTGDAVELGRISDEDLETTSQTQKTQSIEASGTVVTETHTPAKKILPDGTPEEKYKFAISFIKVGDYETAEFALREFVDTNSDHQLAGNAQYWYGETFRIRQLYQDAATAYLDAYQKYPKSSKAPINLLKLGTTLVQIGEKEQGCLMISGVEKQYPDANQSILQKAKYEEKKFECSEKKS